MLNEAQQPDDQAFWYADVEERMHSFRKSLWQWTEAGCAIMIRDPGELPNLQPLDSFGREVYTISSGQEPFLVMLREKSRQTEDIYRRTAKLWDGDEFLFSVPYVFPVGCVFYVEDEVSSKHQLSRSLL